MVLGLSGISLLFSLGVTFGTFRINVMSFFVQAEQVNTNTAEIENLKAHIKGLSDILDRKFCQESRGCK